MDSICMTKIALALTACVWTLTSQLPPFVYGEYLVLNDTLRNASAAQTACTDLGYDGLAQTDTEQTHNEVVALLDLTKYEYWIGMHYIEDKGKHFWDTGFTVPWAAWNFDEPNSLPSDKCVRIRVTKLLATMDCSREYFAVCGTCFAVQWAAWAIGEPDSLPHDKCVRMRTTQRIGTMDCTREYFAVCGTYNRYSRQVNFRWTDKAPSDSSSTIWSGSTRSLIDCVSHCTREQRCQYTAFDSSTSFCTILSSDFDVASGSYSSPGSMLGMKVAI